MEEFFIGCSRAGGGLEGMRLKRGSREPEAVMDMAERELRGRERGCERDCTGDGKLCTC